jgi:hypothetical protein
MNLVVHSPPPYIVSGWWREMGYGKVLIQNPNYEEKGHTESTSSNPTPRVGWRRPPPKIRSPPGMMKFSNVETKEEKEEPFDKLVVTLKYKIADSAEQVTELHLAVYDQKSNSIYFCKFGSWIYTYIASVGVLLSTKWEFHTNTRL